MLNVKFSVVIPTYNRADFLKVCLDSLAAQTFKNFEVLVCDNGSNDDSKQVVESYSDRLHVRYYLLEPSGSPTRPRNHGMKNAFGDWICLLDSDDWWTPEKLEEVNEFTDVYDVLYHQLMRTDGHAESGLICGPLRFSNWEEFFIYGNSIANSSSVFRKDLAMKVGLLDENRMLDTIDDFDFWIRLMRVGARFHFIPKTLGYYYWKPGHNLSSYDHRNIERHDFLLAKHKEFFSSPNAYSHANAALNLRRASILYKLKDWNNLSKIPLFSVSSISGFQNKLKMLTAVTVGKMRVLAKI